MIIPGFTKPKPKADLTTVEGLRVKAEEVGLGEEAEKILATKGEAPKEIFSGGVVSDIFDVLNAAQYGVTGLLKGKSFMEGVRTRQSFSDKDALGDKGLPGMIGGIALDIAVDPLTYIAPVSVLRKIPGLVKAAKATKQAFFKTRLGEGLGRRLIYRFGQDPIYKSLDERRIKNMGVGVSNMLETVRPLTKLDAVTQKTIADARKTGTLLDLPKDILSKAKPAFDELDKLGKEAVDAKLLSQKTYDENVGRYMPRLYTTKEAPDVAKIKVPPGAEKKPLRIDLSRFRRRKDIPENVREAMGEILEAGYPTAKGLVQLKGAIENAKFFSQINKRFAKETAEVGFTKLSDMKSLGELAGKYVPTPIADSINEIIRIKSPAQKILSNYIVTPFKFSKVVLNPGTHARNVMSNFLLNNFEGLSPARLDIYAKAAKQIATKGDLYKEAKAAGLGIDTFAANELRSFLIAPEVKALGKAKNLTKQALNRASNLYQKEEEWAKMAQYIYRRGKGASPEEALRIAERATFNYAQVTPFIRRMREAIWGYPFVTFTYKVTPQVVKTLGKKPTKISNIGKIKQGIENQADLQELAKERATEPNWVRDGFYIKLPTKDKHGRSMYFDLTYIIPFGDLVSGEFLTRDISRETGLREPIGTAVIKRAPFINMIREIGRNQDFRGDKIVRDSDPPEKQAADLFRYLLKIMSPPLIGEQLPGGITKTGERRPGRVAGILEQQRRAEAGEEIFGRTPMFELLRQFGLRIDPIDAELQERFMTSEQRKALQTMLKEYDVIAEFTRPFVPKEKKPERKLPIPGF
jgi:hypothetical protein